MLIKKYYVFVDQSNSFRNPLSCTVATVNNNKVLFILKLLQHNLTLLPEVMFTLQRCCILQLTQKLCNYATYRYMIICQLKNESKVKVRGFSSRDRVVISGGSCTRILYLLRTGYMDLSLSLLPSHMEVLYLMWLIWSYFCLFT